MNDVKPCPFCGGEPGRDHNHDADGFGKFHFIKCSSCKAKTREHFVSKGNDCPEFYRGIWAEWNNRKIAPPADTVIQTCPFCGGSATERIEYDDDFIEGATIHSIKCFPCGSSISRSCLDDSPQAKDEVRKTVLLAWNKRIN